MKKIVLYFMVILLSACGFPVTPIKLGEVIKSPIGFREALNRGYLSDLPNYKINNNLTAEEELRIAEEVFIDAKYHDFRIKPDQLVYGKKDYWATKKELDENGGYGDCNNFSHWVRIKLAERGVESYLVAACVFCEEDNMDVRSLVITKHGYVLDSFLIQVTTLLVQPSPYTLLSSSGTLKDRKWYKVSY